MKEWLKNGTKRVFNYIIPIIFAGIIWELFRPIYIASITAIGQTGNFFVNLYYTLAAEMSLSVFIGILVSCIVGMAVGVCVTFFQRSFEIIKKTETGVQHDLPDIGKLLITAKILISISAIVFVMILFVFYVYVFPAFMLKNRFERKMMIMRAVIPVEQFNELNARWCLMRSKQDYIKLMDNIKKLEEQHKNELEKLSSGK